MGTLPYGIEATVPLAFVGAGFVLSAAALLAAYWPTRRAIRVNPTLALRYE